MTQGTQDQPEDRPTSERGQRPLREIARESGPALRDRSAWLHRRVHRLTFTPTGMVRTEMSLDFSIPDGLPPHEELAGGDGVFYVPVIALRKWPPVMRLDLRDNAGLPFPLLTTEVNQRLDGDALIAVAPPGELRDAAAPLLRAIPKKTPNDARGKLAALGQLLEVHVDDMSAEDSAAWKATLFLAASLAANLLLWVRVTGRPGERVVVKVGFEDPVRSDYQLRRRFLASMSWAPLRHLTVIHDIGVGTSYHIEIAPPEGLEVHRATLKLTAALDAADPEPGQQQPGRTPIRKWASNVRSGLKNTVRIRVARVLGRTSARYVQPEETRPRRGRPYRLETDDRAYLYVSGARDRVGIARLDLATSRRGFRPAALLLGLATTGFMATMTAIAEGAVKHTEPTVAALLLVPALLSYLVVKPTTNPLVRARLLGVRTIIAIVAALPVASCLVLLSYVTPDDGDVAWWWLRITILSAALTCLLALSWLLPPIEEPLHRYRHPLK
jgi:hypothetical protein